MAVAAEEAGWDAFMAWDGISVGPMDTFDPWTVLGAAAVRTSRITLGAMVFSLPRRKPWEVARQALTVDHLSGGRLVLPVGLGAVDDGAYSRVSGETTDVKERAALLDDSLAILDLAWTGEQVQLRGDPPPGHRPGVPAPARARDHPRLGHRRLVRAPVHASGGRARRGHRGPAGGRVRPAEARRVAVRAVLGGRAAATAGRSSSSPRACCRPTPTEAADKIAALEDAGVTWWIDSNWNFDTVTPDGLLDRIRRGPLLV